MKENKNKSYLIIIIVILILVGVVLCSKEFFSKKDLANETPSTNLEKFAIANETESSKNVPNFTLRLNGVMKGTLSQESVKEAKYYEFDAGIDNGFEVVTTRYTGLKFKDYLNELGVEDYFKLILVSKNGMMMSLTPEEITDKMYVVFYRNGELISEDQPLSLLNVEKPYSNSLEELYEIRVYRYELDENEKDGKYDDIWLDVKNNVEHLE